MSPIASIYIPVEDDAFHAVAGRVARVAREHVELRRLEHAELSPPHPWLNLPAQADDVQPFARRLSEELDEVVLGLVSRPAENVFAFWRFESGRAARTIAAESSQAESSQAEAVVGHYDLPRFSDHKLRIGPAWPFRRWELFWSLMS